MMESTKHTNNESSALMNGNLADCAATNNDDEVTMTTSRKAECHLDELEANVSLHILTDNSLHLCNEDSQTSFILDECKRMVAHPRCRSSPRQSKFILPSTNPKTKSKGEHCCLNESEATLPTVCSADDSFHNDHSCGSLLEDSKLMIAYPRNRSSFSVSPLAPHKEQAVPLRGVTLPTMSAPTTERNLSNITGESSSSHLLEESKRGIAYPRTRSHSVRTRRASLPSLASYRTEESSKRNSSSSILLDEKQTIAFPRNIQMFRTRRASLPSSTPKPMLSSNEGYSDLVLEEKGSIIFPKARSRSVRIRRASLPSLSRNSAEESPGNGSTSGEAKRSKDWATKEANRSPWSRRPRSRSWSASHRTRGDSRARTRGLRRKSLAIFRRDSVNQGSVANRTQGRTDGVSTRKTTMSLWSLSRSVIKRAEATLPIARAPTKMGLGRSRRASVPLPGAHAQTPPLPLPRILQPQRRHVQEHDEEIYIEGINNGEGQNAEECSMPAEGIGANSPSVTPSARIPSPGAYACQGPPPFLGRVLQPRRPVQEEGITIESVSDCEGLNEEECRVAAEGDIEANSPAATPSPSASKTDEDQADSNGSDPRMCRAYVLLVLMATIAISAIVVLVVQPTLLYSFDEDDNGHRKAHTSRGRLFPREVGLDMLIGNFSDTTWLQIQQDSSSPQAAAYEWLIQDPSFTLMPPWRHKQRFALAAIFYSLQGQDWPATMRSWLSYDTSECEWSSGHVSPCSSDGEYRRLVLEGMPILHGSLPGEVSLLSGLQDIAVSGMRGEMSLANVLPTELATLSSLKTIDFSNLQLENSTLPTYIGLLTQLKGLHLDGINLAGTIPTELIQMTKLESLTMSENLITGTLLTELSSLTSIRTLWMQKNQLSGPLPTQWSSLKHLHSLFLQNNFMTGTLLAVESD